MASKSKSLIRIQLEDFLINFYQNLRLEIYRLVHRNVFLDPAVLPQSRVVAITPSEGNSVKMPSDFINLSKNYRCGESAHYPPVSVHRMESEFVTKIFHGAHIQIRPKHFLDTGKQYKQRFKKLERPILPINPRETNIVLVPWGLGYASYGDFLNRVLPKLVRILTCIPSSERDNAIVCLPEFSSIPWAREYLELIGIKSSQIYNYPETLIIPPGGAVVVGTSPSLRHGIGHPSDILLMTKVLSEKTPNITNRERRKIYVARRMGRCMGNEPELMEGLTARGFQTFYLEDMSVMEQIRVFKEAEIIVGAHGAGHANIIWANKGVHLLEVFHPAWMHPCYAILSSIMNINYHCLVGYSGEEKGNWTTSSRFGIFENPTIDPKVFFRKIDSIILSLK